MIDSIIKALRQKTPRIKQSLTIECLKIKQITGACVILRHCDEHQNLTHSYTPSPSQYPFNLLFAVKDEFKTYFVLKLFQNTFPNEHASIMQSHHSFFSLHTCLLFNPVSNNTEDY